MSKNLKYKSEKEFDEKVPFQEKMNTILEGLSYYAKVHSPHPAYEEQTPSMYSMQLALEGEELEKAKEMGLTVYFPTTAIPYHHIKLIRKKTGDKTLEAIKPEVIDAKQNTVPEDILIGNESVVKVKFTRHYTGYGVADDSKIAGGVGTRLMKVQVKKLVPYEGGQDENFDVEEEGFSVSDYSGPRTPPPQQTSTEEQESDPFDKLFDEV